MKDDTKRDRADQQDSHPALPLVAALGVMLIWGGTPLFSKLAASEIDPLLVGVLRTVVAAVFALPLLLLGRYRMPADSRGRRLLAFSGIAAFVIFPVLFTVGQSTTSALHGALILATMPVFTSLFGALAERRSVSWAWLAGCVIALSSEAVVIAWRNAGAVTGSSLKGDVIVLVSAFVCALGYVAGARLSQRGYPATATTLWGVTFSGAALLPLLGWSLGTNGWPHAGAIAWGAVLVLAVLTSVLGYVAWYWALAKGGISRIASIQFTQPIFGIVLAAAVLGERPAPVVAAASVGVLAGAWLVLQAGSSAGLAPADDARQDDAPVRQCRMK